MSKQLMNSKAKIVAVKPKLAIPGGEVVIECEGLRPHSDFGVRCLFNGESAHLVGSSSDRVIAIVPDGLQDVDVQVSLVDAGGESDSVPIKVGEKWGEDFHIVANPAVDPRDGSVVVTRSGSRGQKLPATLFRVSGPDDVEEIRAEFMNPTGIAFDGSGKMFVTNRADGLVAEVTNVGEVIPYATDLGIATGIAFSGSNKLYIGDRSGTIYNITDFGGAESFATLEASVSAYHMAFGPDGMLYVTAPGLASFDSIYAIDEAGFERKYFTGLGRPQGLAFDRGGNLYVASCHKGKRGIVKIREGGLDAELFVAGTNVIGLCFGKEGEMFVATNEALYCLPVGISGTLL